MDRFPDMIGRPPEYSGGQAVSASLAGAKSHSAAARVLNFRSLFYVSLRGLKKGSACIHDLGPGIHGVHGPGGRPGERPEPGARLQVELRSRADRPCGRGKRPIDQTTDRPE